MALTDENSSGIPATMLVGPTSMPYPVYNAGGNNGGAAINDGGVPLAQPNQYQDLDEGDTPQDAGVVNGINIVPYLVGGGIGLLILILLILMALRRRKHAQETADATEL